MLARNGVIGNYLYVSSKTGEGLAELRQAIFNSDIKGHGDKIFPHTYKKKEVKKKVRMSLLVGDDSDNDGEIIGGGALMTGAKLESGLKINAIRVGSFDKDGSSYLQEEESKRQDPALLSNDLYPTNDDPKKPTRFGDRGQILEDERNRAAVAQPSNVSAPATLQFRTPGHF